MRGFVVWLTGLSGAGKTTICSGLNERAAALAAPRVFALDGDMLRRGLCSDLGFTAEDRKENVRRVAHLAALLADHGFAVTAALISPYRVDREQAREIIGPERFRLVWVRATLEVCEARDPKGLYKRARSGEIPRFTGVSDPYEEPIDADLVVDTEHHRAHESVEEVWALMEAGIAPLQRP
jgi:adenylyl-sulfate kinase